MNPSSILYLSLFLGLYLSLTPQPADSHFVLFENVGERASSVSYLHVKLTLNLSEIDTQLMKFVSLLHIHNKTMQGVTNDPKDKLKFQYEPHVEWLHNKHMKISRDIIALHVTEAGELKARLQSLRHVLPLPTDGEEFYAPPRHYRPTRNHNETEIEDPKLPTYHPGRYETVRPGTRKARSSGNTFLGILGNVFGLYNTVQIHYLWQELSETKAGQAKLLEVQNLHIQQLKDIDLTFQALFTTMSLHTLQNPGLLDARLNRLHSQLLERIQIAEDVLQQAQHRRLSLKMLSQSQVSTLFARLHQTAAKHGCELLVHHQSDLFQLETSYFFDGKNVNILLHVPMVTPDSILRLFKLHPFPIPLGNGHFIMPKETNDILAITAGTQRYSTQLSSSSLLACHVLNKVYLCESDGVLRKHFHDTCLGALYQQNIAAVRELCTLQVCQNTEVIRQLLGNWFAVFSPSAITVPLECKNGTAKDIMIPNGVSKFHLSAGCSARFADHLVVSDHNIREPADFLEYRWEWDPMDIPEEVLHPENFVPAMDHLANFGISKPSLQELREYQMQVTRTPGWWAHFVHFAGNLLLIVLILALIIVLGIRFHRFLETRRQKAIDPIDNDPVNAKFIPPVPANYGHC